MVSNCAKFYFVKIGDGCPSIARDHGISEAQFRTWNPKVGTQCTGLWAETYACVGIIGGSPTSGPSPTTTSGNSIATPTPTQPQMIKNCNKFYLVKIGDLCPAIASRFGITQQQFRLWNPAVGENCSGLWANTYACVGRVGVSPPPPPTTTQGNGIKTPLPTQTGMVKNCNQFHKTTPASTCKAMAQRFGRTEAQIIRWNPAVGNECRSLWAETYACVGIIGNGDDLPPPPKPSTTKGNGVNTPLPTQTGMVRNCNKFHWTTTDSTCQGMANRYGKTLAQIIKWNPAVGSQCRSLWASTWACVGVM